MELNEGIIACRSSVGRERESTFVPFQRCMKRIAMQKRHQTKCVFFLRIADKSSVIPPCHFRYDLSHGLSVFNFIIRNVFFFSCYFCYFCNYLYCLSLYPKKVLFVLGDMVKRCRRVVLLRHSVACLSLKHLN